MLTEKLHRIKILPAIKINAVEDALPLAEALLEGGISVMEITLRTPVAIDAVKKISAHFPEILLGVGTILNTQQVDEAIEAGAQFGLAAGCNEAIINYCRFNAFAFVPGVSTPSEIEKAYSSGCTIMKIFPIKQLGGPDYIKAINGPYAHLGLHYIAMGGIHAGNMHDYLKLPGVSAVGGSWFANDELVKQKDWKAITRLAKEALGVISDGL